MRTIRQMLFSVLVGIVILGAAGARADTNTITLDLGGGLTLDLIPIQAGEFDMGGTYASFAQPVHHVTLTKSFYMGKTEVTVTQFQQVVGSPPVVRNGGIGGPDGCELPSWPDATNFCAKLSAKSGLNVRLPTEAEWEYACRAGTTGEWFWADGEPASLYVQYSGGGPVGSKLPNPWGLYDTLGNAWEWVNDWWADSYPSADPVIDPQGPATGTGHPERGAAAHSGNPADFTCATRQNASWDGHATDFRVAVDIMVPTVSDDGGASNVGDVFATFNGQLVSTGTSATAVSVYWGTADNGTNTVGWNHVVNFGRCPTGAVSTNVTGLMQGATYYYRFCASNSAGVAWADPAAQFTTASAPAINNGTGAMNVMPRSARLTGNFTAGGTANIYVYWGSTDGGTTPSNWQHMNSLGALGQGTFSCDISGLNSRTTYYYRCYAANVAGSAWAGSTASFQTAPSLADGAAGRLKVTFAGYNNAETLTNFPALVVLGTNIANFTYAQFASANGYDLRFIDVTETTNLNYEIERWMTNGSSLVWVQVPAISSSNDFIWAYWGNSAAQQQAYTTNGATWGSNYRGVWHLDETAVLGQTSALHFDSTSNHLTGVQGGNASTNGMVGGAQYFDGNHRYIDITNNTSPALDMGGNFTFSAWLAFDDTAAGWNRPVSRYDVNGWEFAIVNDTNLRMTGTGGTADTAPNMVPSWTSHNWYYVAVVANGASVSFYRDGVLQTSSGNLAPVVDNDCILTFGYNAAHNDGPWKGRIDEARLQQGTASPNWIWASWMTMASNSVFSSYQIQSGSTSTAATVHGIPYSWLQSYGITNTSDSVETQHVAGSSLNVLQNYIAGINPTNPNSRFCVSITNSAGQIVVRIPSVQATGSDYSGKARYYDVELRTNLLLGAWQPVPNHTNILGNGSLILYTNASQDQTKFYRVTARLQ
jgi:hypothetical protein